jgi:hypothetical protein
MLVFPQLLTGASALYPVTLQLIQRTVVNNLGDGSTVVFADPDAWATGWELHASGMTLAEWTAVEALFVAASGMWQTFTFLDPTGNLLEQSEDFGAGTWTNGALIELTAGVADPVGTSRATGVVNAGGAVGAVAQTRAVPGNFTYCLSVWARSSGGSGVKLMMSGATRGFVLTSTWQRISFTANLGTSATSVTFGVELVAGASVDLFGMQVEAQLAPSDYKITTTRGGVYSNARFGADTFTVTAQGTDVFDAVIPIVNTEN